MAFHPDITRRDDVSLALDAADAAVRLASRQMTGNAGSVTIPNADGTKTVMGVDAGASGIAPWVGDTTAPGAPTGLTAQSGSGMIVVSWDGTLDGGVPSDFSHITLMIDGAGSGDLSSRGSCVYGPYDSGSAHVVSAVAYDDAHDQDGSSTPNASPASDPISVTVTGSDIDPSKLGITVTKSIVAASAAVPGVNKGDLWLKYDKDPTAGGAALIGEWWWNSTEWVEIPVNIYLDQLASRGINADSAVIGLIASGIITSGLFQTSSDNPRSYFDEQGFHSTDADGNLVFDTNSGVVTMLNAIADNMTATNLKAVGGSVSLVPKEQGTTESLYTNNCETDADAKAIGGTLSSEQSHSGSHSVKLESPYMSEDIPLGTLVDSGKLIGGATYTADYWVYSSIDTGSLFMGDHIVWSEGLQGAKTYRTVNGWNHMTVTIKVPYNTQSQSPYPFLRVPMQWLDGEFKAVYIDDLKFTRIPYGAGSYYGLGDDGFPKLEMYDSDGSVLISLKSSDSGTSGGKVVFATKNGIFLGTDAQQPQLYITDSGVGVSSSERIDLNTVNGGIYANNHRIGYDTGWVDIKSQMTGLPSGASYKTMYARVINDMCIIAGRIEGISANQGNPYGAGTIPAAYRPASNSPIIGGAANPGGGAFLSPSGAINCRNLYPGGISWTEFSIGPYPLT
ncbi:hypothetical protein [Bifidobacterium psychraerophilum]|uniref:hypothetical protein n=1 Tax=Bifidobacterium psychraerophilum TaxID=218140 RepID=UPI0039EC24BD